jgi:hypothetical protein
MKSSTSTQNLLVKILALLLLFNITVLASNFNSEVSVESHIVESTMLESSSVVLSETVEVSLDSFNNIGILILIALSSILGAFFVKDEFSEMLEKQV